jgi:uncharacterized membrane protein YhaH (DUF805 family)
MNPIKLLWSFYGRIGRLGYLGGLLLNLSLAVAAIAALIYLGQEQPKPPPGRALDPFVYIAIPGFILFTWAKLALAAKRFHDLGKSGWLGLVLFIPLFGFIAVIFLLVAPGDDYDNQYGLSRSSGSPSSARLRAV